ncbi:hypothetical protein N9O28_01915 [Emcibacteraceae bacterium]|nr:hypothetical protein [Emcibacteraceae bacterium]
MRNHIMKTIFTVIIITVFQSLSLRAYADTSTTVKPITTNPWQEVVVSTYDIDEAARFFLEIAEYGMIWRGEEDKAFLNHLGLDKNTTAQSMVLKAKGTKFGYIRLIEIKGQKQTPIRPGARPWDTGCYTSIMMRASNLEQIYDDAIRMSWWTETPITDLEFGPSKLKIVIFKGPQGLQIEAYERLSPPLPESFPKFDRLSLPFNIMQTVKNRENSRKFFIDMLGFDTFFYGNEPTVAKEAAQMPLGIPINLTTTSRYQAGILYPQKSEVGRVELVEFMDLEGEDYAANCHAPNFGILSIKFPVASAKLAKQELINRGLSDNPEISKITIAPYGDINIFSIKTPDGANIEFYSIEK